MIPAYAVRRYELAQTSSSIDEELWLLLRHPAEVRDAGHRLIAFHNPERGASDTDSALWQELRAYVRQAENFYRGASVLPWTSSPLNFYYSFLNLAKACCLLRDLLPPLPAVSASPALMATAASPATTASGPRRLRHGISEHIRHGVPDLWQLTVNGPNEVFPLLYKLLLGTDIAAGTAFDAHDLFAFVPSIGFQLKESGYPSMLGFRCKWIMVMTEAEAWDIIGIPADAPIALMGDRLTNDYEQVENADIKPLARDWWGQLAHEVHQYAYFQRREPQPLIDGHLHSGRLRRAFDQTFSPYASEYLWGDDHQFMLYLTCPTQNGGARVPMNQLAASYAIMFFLSSLVRYHPEYMDAIAQSSDAWLIESFVKSTPTDMLRAFTTNLLGYTLVMKRM